MFVGFFDGWFEVFVVVIGNVDYDVFVEVVCVFGVGCVGIDDWFEVVECVGWF